jgi:threonine dehydratase/cystathionine beta-lyase/cystathionine gamma-synthase
MPHVTDHIISSTLAEATEKAKTTIEPFVIRTPTIRLPWLDSPDREVWAKLECWQISGSVKARGVFNVMASFETGQRCVTAARGNQGLAVANASAALGLSCVVFVPIGAPTVQTRRIRELGGQVEIAGANVMEAAEYAADFSQSNDLPFVSPFGNWLSAAGMGTCVAEASDDVGTFDSVMIPLGSGSLLAGAGTAAVSANPSTKVLAIHPATFGRSFARLPISECLREPVTPTLADALGVQVPSFPRVLATILDELPVVMIEVDEPTISLGVYALLHRQNLLVEGAGAAAVGALLTAIPASGRTLLVLSGGNISSSDLARAYAAEVTDPRVRRHLGLRRRTPILNLPAPRLPIDHVLRSAPQTTSDPGQPPRLPLPSLDAASSLLAEHRRYAQSAGLHPSPGAHEVLDSVLAITAKLHHDLGSNSNAECEDDVRVLHRLVGFLQQSMEWASPAHDQSQRINFFDPAAQMPDIANYARYGNSALHEFELSIGEMLGFQRNDVEVLATSSGMASYQLLESYLLRHVLQAGDAVVCAPYIYFEAREQLRSLPFLTHIQAPSFDPNTLVATVEENDARVLFVDPVANIAGLPRVDIRQIARLTVGRPEWSERWIVIDGTMISGGIDIYSLFPPDAFPRVLYYESASKYAQLGLDLQMAGICLAPRSIASELRVQRRNTGTVLYPEAVSRFPRTERASFLARMRLMTSNAGLLAERLLNDPTVCRGFSLGVVGDWADYGWQHGGGVVTVKSYLAGLDNRDVLESLIERIMHSARSGSLPLVRGVSFGLSTTRVSAASSTAEFHDPFLRLSIGIERPDVIERLADILIGAMSQHLVRFQ